MSTSDARDEQAVDGTARSGSAGIRWMRILHEPVSHAVTADGVGEHGWRPLCQQGDYVVVSGLLLREASNGDEFCDVCRTVLGDRIRRAVEKRRRAAAAAAVPDEPPTRSGCLLLLGYMVITLGVRVAVATALVVL